MSCCLFLLGFTSILKFTRQFFSDYQECFSSRIGWKPLRPFATEVGNIVLVNLSRIEPSSKKSSFYFLQIWWPSFSSCGQNWSYNRTLQKAGWLCEFIFATGVCLLRFLSCRRNLIPPRNFSVCSFIRNEEPFEASTFMSKNTTFLGYGSCVFCLE